MDDYRDDTVKVPIGEPLLQCSPFAQVVTYTQKGEICDFCLKTLSNISSKFICPGCKHYFYCSDDCLKKDHLLHQNECSAEIQQKIDFNFSTVNFKNKIPKLFLSHEDMVEYTRLFFRVLKCSKMPDVEEYLEKIYYDYDVESMETDQIERVDLSPFNATFGDSKRRIAWQDIICELDLSDEQDDSDEVINNYMEEYDKMTENERIEQDTKLGYKLPDDNFFRNIIILNEVTLLLDNMIDKVADVNESQCLDAYTTPDGNYVAIEDNKINSQATNVAATQEYPFTFLGGNGSDEKLYENFINDLKDRNCWNMLTRLPYDQKMKLMYNFFESYKHDFDSNQSGNPLMDNAALFKHNSEEIDEETQIQSLKMMFRMFKLDMIFTEKNSREKKPMDGQFGFWIICIKEILELDEVKIQFGSFAWNDIVKAFYVTLRFSIAIPDMVYNLPIARGVFLPMTLLNHSCMPNTSAIFDGSTLKLFYLPSKELKVQSGMSFFNKVSYDQSTHTIYDPKLTSSSCSSIFTYLPLKNSICLDGLNFDFQYDLFSKIDSANLFILNKMRLIECYCERCVQTKLVDVEKSINDDKDNDFFLMDDCPSWDIDFQNDNQDKYGNCLSIVEQLNAQYGNYRDHEYSMKIQVPVNELIECYRQMLGHYHPKISVLLLFLSYSKLILLKDQKENHMIFYQYKFLHDSLLQTIESFSITHGRHHRFLNVFESIHTFVHQQLALFYNLSKDVIYKIERFKSDSSLWPPELFSMANCSKLKLPNVFSSKVTDIFNNDLVQSDGSLIKSDDIFFHTPAFNDDYTYNPFVKKRRFSYEEDVVGDFSPKDDEPKKTDYNFANERNDMSMVFNLMLQICAFSEFRKL